jgi:hypothetical protein
MPQKLDESSWPNDETSFRRSFPRDSVALGKGEVEIIRAGGSVGSRIVAILVMVGSFGYVSDVFANSLIPSMGESLTPVLVLPSVLAEVALIVWLMKGLKFGTSEGLGRARSPVPAAAAG